MQREVELKLDVAPGDVDALAALLIGPPRWLHQRSVYFDTPDGGLARHGLGLRIRECDGKRVQTVKAAAAGEGPSAGLFSRLEWETPVAGDLPEIDDASPVRLALGNAADRLVPQFTVDVTRRLWTLEEAGSRIEVVLDTGSVSASGRQAPFAEVELELLAGEASALFALARRLDMQVPLRPAVLSKADRGQRLLAPVTQADHATVPVLAADAATGEVVPTIIAACLAQYRLNEERLLASVDAEPLHQARVGLRRLRAALSLFRDLVGGRPEFIDDVRWLAQILGEARDLDVMLARAAPGPLRDSLLAARDTARTRVAEALAAPRTRALMIDIAAWLAIGPWRDDPVTQAAREQPATDFAITALNRLRRRVKKARSALDNGDDAARHEFRKRAKALRYAAEFLGPLFPATRRQRRLRRFVAALTDLQHALGSLNDLVTAQRLLAGMGVTRVRGTARLVGLRRRPALIAAASAAHDDLVDCKRFWR